MVIGACSSSSSWSKSNPHDHKPLSKGDEKSGLSGAAIAGIVLGVLLALVLVIALFTRRRSSTPPSHFIDEDRVSQRRPFTPLSSQELSNDSRSEILKDFRGNSLHTFSSFSFVCK